MARVLKRPMFRRGGSTNDGIMSGLVDRKKLANGPINPAMVGQSARDYISQFEPILREFTPKTRLPLGAVGAALVGGTPIKQAITSGYTDFAKRDDAREAAIRSGAVKLGIGQALKDIRPSDKRSQIDLKAREAFSKKVVNPKTGKPFASYNEAYTFYSMSAADPGRRSIPGDVERSKQNFIAQGTYGDNEVLAERHAIANTIVKKAVPQGENYTGRRIKIKDGKYKTQGEAPGIYVDVIGNKIIEINPDGTTEERPELTAILQSYR